MRLIVHTFVFSFIVIGLCQGKVRITYPAKSEYHIKEGDELKIQCKGDGELQFSTQELTGNFKQSESVHDSEPGMYTFIRRHAAAIDTGWYACAKQGIEIKNDEQRTTHISNEYISWIYVFVNSSESPFAVMHDDWPIITVMAGATAVIPCRPTDSSLRVRLNKGVDRLEQDSLNYDSKIGYIMKNVLRGDGDAVYECDIGDEIHNDVYSSYKLIVTPRLRVSSEDIESDPIRDVDLGGNLTLFCNVGVLTGVSVTLNWSAPTRVPGDRLNEEPGTKNVVGSRTMFKKSLTITDAHLGDTGDYICNATIADESATSKTEVTVHDPDHPYIDYYVEDGKNFITVSENHTATWIIRIVTSPPNPRLDWYKGDRLIENPTHNSSDNQSKYRELLEKRQHFYEILKLNISDTGNYTIRINTGRDTAEIPLRLEVHAKPLTAIQNLLPYYKPGDTAIISCNATGLPIPNVTWSFSKWQSERNTESILPLHEPVSSGDFSVLSNVNMSITAMGNLTCTSCNEKGCTNDTEPIFISDGAGFFGVIGPDEVIEGDNLTLNCAASVYNFTGMVEWNFTDSEGIDFRRERMTNTTQKTIFTSQAILEIRDVKQTDAGTLVCVAESRAGDIVKENYTFSVKPAQAPIFTNFFEQKTLIHINLKKGNKIGHETLRCPFVGVPRPIIIWRKDGEPLKFNENRYEFTENNSTLTVTLAEGDRGNYSCTVGNRRGRIQRYFNIVVAGKKDNTALWVSLISVLIIIIIIVITWMGIKVHRERVLRKELLEAGLTHFEDGALECLNPDLTVDDQAELLPYDKKWEFPREYLKLGKQLGSGAFGVVMKAEARGICVEGEVTTVAVKMVRRSADPSYMKALSSELKIMIHLGRHLNVVNLLGACTKTILTKRELYVIVEYCRYGNLHNYLQRHRSNFIDQIDPSTQKVDPNIGVELLVRSDSVSSQNGSRYKALSTYRSISVSSSNSTADAEPSDYRQGIELGNVSMSPDGCVLSNNSVQPGWRSNYRGDYREHNSRLICTQDLLCWAWQVACGMEYLSSRKVLHGDLAARNILLAKDNIVKICDFGLAKNMYKDNNYKKKGDGPLPIKWMAIESIRDRMFSTQSDVWSFGIVLWEFFSLARTPYPGMEAEKQYDRLIEGYRMEKPEYATDEIYDFMLQCWKAKPSLRPTFPDLVSNIGALLNDGIKMQYLDKNTPYMDMNIQALQNGQSDYLTMMSSPNHECLNSPDAESNYLPMSPISRAGTASIFSPRPDVSEQHFDFPQPEDILCTDSDPVDCTVAVELHGTRNSDESPIDVHQESVGQKNLGEENIQIPEKPDHAAVTNDQHYINWKNESPDKLKGPDRNLSRTELLKNNNKDFSSPAIAPLSNYTNLPQKDAYDTLKDPIIDSFSNPSYVIMSK